MIRSQLSQLQRWTFNRPSKYFGNIVRRNNDKFLRTYQLGLTLNLCCGYDTHGDVLVDVDLPLCREMQHLISRPEVICASALFPPFREESFDSVIIDPPFSFFKKWKWLLDIFDLARLRLIVSCSAMNLGKKGWHREIYYTNSNHLCLRLWYVFDRITPSKEFHSRLL